MDDEKFAGYKGEITELTDSLKKLRREVWLCEDIKEHSEVIRDKIHREREYNRVKIREQTIQEKPDRTR